jgi:DNA repair photolyase
MAARSHLETDTEASLRAEAEQQGYRLVRANTKTLDAECVPHEFKYRLEILGKAGKHFQDLSDPYGVWGRLYDVRAYLIRPAEPAAADAADAPATADAAPDDPVASPPKAEVDPVDPMAIPDFLRRAPAARADVQRITGELIDAVPEPERIPAVVQDERQPAGSPQDETQFAEPSNYPPEGDACRQAPKYFTEEQSVAAAKLAEEREGAEVGRLDREAENHALALGDEYQSALDAALGTTKPLRNQATVGAYALWFRHRQRGLKPEQIYDLLSIDPPKKPGNPLAPMVRKYVGRGKRDRTGEQSKLAKILWLADVRGWSVDELRTGMDQQGIKPLARAADADPTIAELKKGINDAWTHAQLRLIHSVLKIKLTVDHVGAFSIAGKRIDLPWGFQENLKYLASLARKQMHVEREDEDFEKLANVRKLPVAPEWKMPEAPAAPETEAKPQPEPTPQMETPEGEPPPEPEPTPPAPPRGGKAKAPRPPRKHKPRFAANPSGPTTVAKASATNGIHSEIRPIRAEGDAPAGAPADAPVFNADGVSLRGCTHIYAPAGQAGEYAPLACNPYRGCGHGCVYCYVPPVIHMPRKEFDAGAVLRPDFMAALRREAAKYRAAGVIEQVMLSFTSDPYHLGETAPTRETLEVLIEHGLAICTLSKGGTRALRDLPLFRPSRDAYAATLTSLDDRFSKKWERNAALPGDRIAALKRFHEAGIFTWVSLEPTLDVESSLAIVEATSGFVNLFRVGRANYLKEITRTTDWADYTARMIDLLNRLSAKHYIKKDLQPFLPPGYVNPLRVPQHH